MTTRSTIITRTLGAALAAGLAFGLAACGNEYTGDAGSTQGQGSTQSGSGADDATVADKTLTKDDIMRAAYTAAVKAKSAHITMNVSGATSMKAAGDVAYAARQPTMSMTMSQGQGTSELRFVGGLLYMQIPGMTPPGKFVSIDPKDKKSPYAKAFGDMTSQMDPLHSIKAMEKAVQSVEPVGKETVDGVETEHYEVVVDTAALLDQMGPGAAKQASVPKTVTYEMWLDDQDLLRQMRFAMSGASLEAKMTDWGKPVTVKKPAAGDVVDMSTMMSSQS